jgi:transglutaminase-like putative cysteine protease
MTLPSRKFIFEYHVKIFPHDADLDLWLPSPRTDAYQTIVSTSISSPVPLSLAEEPVDHNQILHGLFPAVEDEQTVVVRHQIERFVRQAPPPHEHGEVEPSNVAALARFLQADSRVPIDGPVVEATARTVPRNVPPRDRARQIFEHLLDTLDYDSGGCTPDRAHELGDLVLACDLRRGTCTEFHGLYVAQARALGLPARFAFGFNIPQKPEGQIAGYHCWSEVFLPEVGWFAVDVSEAWKRTDPRERSFYFGNLDANRVQFTTGRDVSLVPSQRSGSVDRFIFPLAEVGGRREDVALAFSFVDVAHHPETP